VSKLNTYNSPVSYSLNAVELSNTQVLLEDGERRLCRASRLDNDGSRESVLVVLPAVDRPSRASLDRLAHEYELRDDLDSAWALRPLELARERDRAVLLLEDNGGEPLEQLLVLPLQVGHFLHLAITIAGTLSKVHRRGLIHKDIKPANIFVNRATWTVTLTGFGIASRLTRERHTPTLPEFIAGTLAYMAPEQTGRINRSVDSRCDLYALGVTLYQMLTGALPFNASDPMEWVHCHVARQPAPPSERLKNVPAPLSAIIMKLLAKMPEERYQTAAGLEGDLRHCLADWDRQGRIDSFPLGRNDIPDRLFIPEKLYGRTRDVETLLASFDRIVKSGAPELVLVSGFSGIGKSSVVNELHKVLVPPRGLFASGKFDQYKRDIPYSTLAQAFQSLIRPILGMNDMEVSAWRNDLMEALGPNGQLVVDLVPELKVIIGDQPPVPELPPQDSRRRFQLVFRRFINVFARPEHPLALFLDDLQWLDTATLDLLQELLTGSDLPHLMLIGAYRDNEVDAAHPLKQQLQAIEFAGGKVVEITLTPLSREELGQLISDTLRCELARAASLAQLVHDKTRGNPFFAIQFISSLADEGMLIFDHDAMTWSWNLDRIHAKAYTDNVVDFMVGKLARLPPNTQNALQMLACLGNSAEVTKLAIALDWAVEQTHAAVWRAVHQELLEGLAGAYRFAHDRVQEAAYSLIPEQLRTEVHLRIGRRLAAHIPLDEQEEEIFDVVNQLDRGAGLITSRDEREQLAELNLRAGKRAKASAAYSSALTYLVTGSTLLSEDCWERRHELIFELELLRAECEFLTGAMVAADSRLKGLSCHAANMVERALVACLRIDLYTTVAQSTNAITVGLDYLRHLGLRWSLHPTDHDVRREYDRIWLQLGSRSIEDILELPLMTDPASLATMDVLTKVAPAAFTLMEANFHALAVCWAANLSLEWGNCDASCDIYVRLGFIAGDRFGDYKSGARLGGVGHELVEQWGLTRFQARTYLLSAHFLVPYTRHVRAARDLLDRGFEVANKIGDLMFVGWYRGLYLIENLLAAGDPLSAVQREAEHGLAFAQKAQLVHVVHIVQTHLQLVRTLRGLTRRFGSFDEEDGDVRFAENPRSAFADWLCWMRKVQARFHAGEYALAIEAAARTQQYTASGYIQQIADLLFYSALSHAALCDGADQAISHFAALSAHHRRLEVWADQCSENFECRAALVGAEIARIESRDSDAMSLYERAIRSARGGGLVHYEAIAYERASAFYRARGFDELADFYLQNARDRYIRWGAEGKVRHLDQLYPQLRREQRARVISGTIDAPVEHLDLTTVIKVAQAVSSDIVLEKLLETLMRTAIEQSGAVRGVLILPRGAVPRIAAEAVTLGDTVFVQLRDEPVTAAALPQSIVHYVLRTRESVIMDDGTILPPFAADAYINQHKLFSVLCMPLVNQGNMIGLLYLENTLTFRVFAPARITVLKLLAAQAAISIENTRLYRDLAEREARIRRLVDANIAGIFIWDIEGRILEANDAFLNIVGYDRADLVSGRIHWTDLTPSEQVGLDANQRTPEFNRTDTLQTLEKEFYRKDGTRVPVLIGRSLFQEGGNEGVAFILDLTERKRAQQEHERLRQLESDLAHMNRLTMMGELAASLAHEIKQPIAAARNNACAALNFLNRHPPDLSETREALDSIVGDADRAGNIIDRIRDQIKKAPPRKLYFDLNEAIREVTELARSAIIQNGVTVRIRIAEKEASIEGDRVQLQQVILNLLLNAVEAMSSVEAGAREVSISTERSVTNDVLVALRDSGPGIGPEDRERVFQAFYTTKSTGAGMGLAICRSIIEAHGGRLWVDANEPHGAAFQFILPRAGVREALSGPRASESHRVDSTSPIGW
jgi:PAS domain S-box-containing protein